MQSSAGAAAKMVNRFVAPTPSRSPTNEIIIRETVRRSDTPSRGGRPGERTLRRRCPVSSASLSRPLRERLLR